MREKKVFVKAFGKNEFGFADFPIKISNVQVSRIESGEIMGCSYCFPHGWETVNSTIGKNKRNWKHYRKKQYRIKNP